MALIIGFDPSKCTGWSVFDTTRNIAAIRCGVFEMPTKADEYYTADQLGLKVRNFIRDIKEKHGRLPDFAVLEQQMQAQAKGSSFAGSLYPWIATAAIVSTLANFGIPYGSLMPSTWRRMFFGQGFKPTITGKETSSQAWKRACIARCEAEGIELPRIKAHADDAAEACAVAVCWASKDMNLHAGRYHEPWMKLLQARNQRQVAA